MHRPFHRRLAGALVAVAAASGTIGLALPVAGASGQPAPVHQLLTSAARTESAAYLQYYAYATEADSTGRTDVANVFRTVGDVEHQDHWTHEINDANLYSGSDNIANLKMAISQANQTAGQDRAWAAKNPNSSAAGVLRTTAARESDNAKLLSEAVQAQQGHGSVPSAPAVSKVTLRVSPQPNYSGTFYSDLTSGSDSALEQSAWLWAEYQYMGKTAVDTGEANLAALFSGLEAQEQKQNWVQIANVAGYVNGNANNLTTSIGSEEGAIQMYTNYAQEAQTAGNPTIASTFTSIKGDERGHRHTFSTDLTQITHG